MTRNSGQYFFDGHGGDVSVWSVGSEQQVLNVRIPSIPITGERAKAKIQSRIAKQKTLVYVTYM